ncbi:MAG: hypothetical protein B7X11_03355 [Acidobacteria bacterium 37-65-4]|nr:MAG: hypothetical protein B7X11_03355 [Acidobacteria bacterium 37-65-4]
MRHHIDVLGLLHMVWGVFGVLTGLSLVILATGTHAALAVAGSIGAGSRAAVWLMAVTGALMLTAGLAWFATGRRLRRLETRARMWALVLAIPNLLVIPFGTALGIYTFWVLLNNDAREVFGRPARHASV